MCWFCMTSPKSDMFFKTFQDFSGQKLTQESFGNLLTLALLTVPADDPVIGCFMTTVA